MQGHRHPHTFSRLASVLEMDKGEGIQRGPLKRHRVLLRREWEHVDQRAFSKQNSRGKGWGHPGLLLGPRPQPSPNQFNPPPPFLQTRPSTPQNFIMRVGGWVGKAPVIANHWADSMAEPTGSQWPFSQSFGTPRLQEGPGVLGGRHGKTGAAATCRLRVGDRERTVDVVLLTRAGHPLRVQSHS